MNFNKVILCGHLSSDPEVRYTPNGTAITGFSLAVNRSFKKNNELQKEVSFFEVTVFGKNAENCGQYLSKGSGVLIEGRLKQDVWQADDGSKRSKVKVIADHVQFLSKPKEGSGTSEKGGSDPSQVFDEEIPF